MTVASARSKLIKVGQYKSALFVLPNVTSYDINEDRDAGEWGILRVKGWARKGDLKDVSSVSSYRLVEKSLSESTLSVYEFSADFRICEETSVGFELFNEDDTV
jgi:hypothetical protein